MKNGPRFGQIVLAKTAPGGLFWLKFKVPQIKSDRKGKLFLRYYFITEFFSLGPKMKKGQYMAMAKMAKNAISAIISARMVGKKVYILKFSVESIDHDQGHDVGHDHDYDHENCYLSHFKC